MRLGEVVDMKNEFPAGLHLRRVDNQISRRMALETRKRGIDDITGSNGWILGFLKQNEQREVFQKDVEAEFMLARSTVTAVIKLMEQKGYIRRESVAYDGRLKRLLLTEKGAQAQQQMGSVIADVEAQLVAGISEEELAVFHEVLRKIGKNAEA